ncbi:MAG: FtsW/RodA/SpoVE family cell cycle protein, partial [Anaerolineae bacterium]|nr:FtsW/RodA/SpoVE family cell cycle protein [Anaerolineae bacterium]
MTIYRIDASYGLRQSVWLLVCFALMFIGLRFGNNILPLLRKYKYFLLTAGLVLVGLTFILGTYPTGSGPKLWLGCCGIYFQPSEPLKLLMVIFLAGYLADRALLTSRPVTLIIPSAILAGLATALLLAQRDLGTALLLILIYFAIIYLGTGKRRIMVIACVIAVIAGGIGYQAFDVIRVRIEAWIFPWLDTGGNSYQVLQSLMGIANGGVFGSGLGLGSPGFIPVAISDFIFSAISEEAGLAGAVALIILYSILIMRGLLISIQARNSYHRYLAAGIAIYFAVQTILIMGGNNRLLPITGVTLPFVSYGGSSLVTSFVAAFLLLIISPEKVEVKERALDQKPYLFLSAIMLISLIMISLTNGWWGVMQSNNILSREDNPRRSLNDRFVQRGKILDRSNLTLAETIGVRGSYERIVKYTQLSPVLGYTNPTYGLAGIERSMDGYLRGLQGNPSSMIITSSLLYNQPPEGLNVRLSIDLEYQIKADQALGEHVGSIVLVQAETGEILAMASHPNINPNLIEENWDAYIEDEHSPFLNRAVQGLYPPSTITGPFLLAYAYSAGSIPVAPTRSTMVVQGRTIDCAVMPSDGSYWGDIVSSGCPYGALALAKLLGNEALLQLYPDLGWTQTLSLPISVAEMGDMDSSTSPNLLAVGESGHLITPLHAALAASALSTNGKLPKPLLATSVLTPHQGWVILPTEAGIQSLPPTGVDKAVQSLAVAGEPFWLTLATTQYEGSPVTWCIGGTLTAWQGSPLAVAVALEEDDPQ